MHFQSYLLLVGCVKHLYEFKRGNSTDFTHSQERLVGDKTADIIDDYAKYGGPEEL